jgi:phosphate:Na+ symporter
LLPKGHFCLQSEFVNAGLMTLKQAVGVIMGANIGTTVTAQLIAFKITQYILPLIAVGFAIHFLSKTRVYRYIGQVILGFGILMLGMDTMSMAVEPLKESAGFSMVMTGLGSHPFWGLAVGAALTAIIQSSSAFIGILIALSSQGLIPLETALPLLLGSNIGTCITAVLAGIGQNLTAKRAALAHVLFNVLGSLLFMVFLKQFALFILAISPNDHIARQIANAHTFFNVINTIIFLPLINHYVHLIVKLAPGREELVPRGPIYLDERMLGTPAIALSLASKELVRMAQLAQQMVAEAMESFIHKDEQKARQVFEHEEIVDELADEITVYLAKISQKGMNPSLSKKHTGLLHGVTDVERIGDHAENIAEMAMERIAENLPFSDEALEEITALSSLANETFLKAISALQHDAPDVAREALELEKGIDDLERELRRNHISRINTGKCFPGSGVIYLDIMSNLERVGDHSNNIASAVLGKL